MISRYQIIGLGHRGDGLTDTPEGSVAIPYTLPGETVEAEITGPLKGRVVNILIKSPHRQEPLCSYFGQCGGCTLQHLNHETYIKFKQENIQRSLHFHGFSHIPWGKPFLIPPHTRRRANLTGRKIKGEFFLGYFKKESKTLVSIESCPVLFTEIEKILIPLRYFLKDFLTQDITLDIFITAADQGLDVAFGFTHSWELTLDQRLNLAAFARDFQLARLTILFPKTQETIVCLHEPTVTFGGIPVKIEANSFLQVSPQIDRFFARYLDTVFPVPFKKAADLFCGRGTFSIPLAQKGPVDAYEMEDSARIALDQAARKYHLPLKVFQQNLFSKPLGVDKLNQYDIVILDPPRGGAQKQCETLAQAKVSQIIMVSCHHPTFARDAQILRKGGYQLRNIQLIDQFLWSPHTEVIATFQGS